MVAQPAEKIPELPSWSPELTKWIESWGGEFNKEDYKKIPCGERLNVLSAMILLKNTISWLRSQKILKGPGVSKAEKDAFLDKLEINLDEARELIKLEDSKLLVFTVFKTIAYANWIIEGPESEELDEECLEFVESQANFVLAQTALTIENRETENEKSKKTNKKRVQPRLVKVLPIRGNQIPKGEKAPAPVKKEIELESPVITGEQWKWLDEEIAKQKHKPAN